MPFSSPRSRIFPPVASISAGARHFNWRRFAYLLAMAGAAGAAIALAPAGIEHGVRGRSDGDGAGARACQRTECDVRGAA